MIRRTSLLTALVGLAMGGGALQAQAAEVTQGMAVKVAGLDLSQDRDAERLAARITQAALEVCGGGRGSLMIVNRSVLKSACWSQAVARAADDVNAPKVSAALASVRGR